MTISPLAAGGVAGTIQPHHLPVAVQDIDLEVPSSPSGREGNAIVLVRAQGRPLGALWVPSGSSDSDVLETARGLWGPQAAAATPVVPGEADLSVVICAIRASDQVLATIHAALDQVVMPREVILVDNRPQSSGLRELVDTLNDPRVRYVSETESGLSCARNRGLHAARGSKIAFTDDDVFLDREWVARLDAAFAPGVDCVTGLVLPMEVRSLPQLLIEQFGGFAKGFTPQLFNLGDHRPDDSLFPFRVGVFGSGANSAFRAEMLRELGGFDDRLGTGSPTRGGEDLDIFLRVILAGGTIAYEPAALVRHDHESGEDEFQKRVHAYGMGLSSVLFKHLVFERGSRAAMISRIPRGLEHLVSPSSSKNVNKSEQYRKRYVALEAWGLLQGPFAYLSAARSRSATPVKVTPPTWSASFDLANDEAPGLVDPAPMSDPAAFGMVRTLVRENGEVLGFVESRTILDDAGLPTLNGDQLKEDAAADGGLVASRPTIGARSQDAQTAGPHPMVSVVVCTRDRAEKVADALTLLQKIQYPNWEVILVDNAPSDCLTKDRFDAQVGHDPRFRYLIETRPGLSAARNCGIRHARGDIIAFTDDDTIIEPTWVRRLADAFRDRPEVGCVTGLIAPARIVSPAEQYFEQRIGWGGRLTPREFAPDHDLEDRLFPYSPGIMGAGANFAFRADIWSKIGMFDEALGAGSASRGGEDLDIMVRTVRAGYTLVYEPAAVVWHRHRVDEGELAEQMFGYGAGLSAFVTKQLVDPDSRSEVLARVVPGVRRLFAATRRTLGQTSDVGAPRRRLVVSEVKGMAMGPLLYRRALASAKSGAEGYARSS